MSSGLRKRPVIRGTLYGCAAIALTLTLVIAFCPKPSLYGDTSFSLAVEDRNGELLRLMLADDDHYRLRTSLDDIATAAVDATILYEDRHFFSHPGFNPGSLIRGAWVTYVTRQRMMGGSTISMQLARMRFDLDSRSVSGKLVQVARAIQLERHYSKEEILEAYLNVAPYGGNIEGIGTAALIYFGKPASELSLPEAFALAVIPQNPAKRVPASGEGYLQTFAARDRLFDLWQDEHGINDELAQQFEMPLRVQSARDLPFEAPHFVQRIAGENPATSRYRSTIDLTLQRTLQQQISDHVDRYRNSGIRNASAMLLDTRSMQLLASVGSADFFDNNLQGQVDGTQAKRSPGSTLKPFVYGLAIDAGLIHPMTLLKDAPQRFAAYTPENFDRGFMGPVFAKDALVYSRNVPAIDLLSRVGPSSFHGFLEAGEVADLRSPEFYGLAAVLGGIELTMEEIVGLYAMLANDGMQMTVSNSLNEPAVVGPRLLSPEASFLVLDMLRENPRPNALRTTALVDTSSIAWKTGTSYAYRDAWSVGVVGPYILAVWVGNFDGSSNPAFVGREAAAPLFFSISDAIIDPGRIEFRTPEPTPDLNLARVDVCAQTGDLPGRHCPGTVKAWFVPGVSPIRVSDIHRLVHIDKESGLRTCNPEPDTSDTQVFEFWPSDISRLFLRAGIAVRKPPDYMADCSMDVLATTGLPPTINSVSERLTYQVRADRANEEQLPLLAATDADAKWLYWFVDQNFLGKVRNDEAMFWQPVAGIHDILAVDDLGRSDARRITVDQLP